MRHHHQRAALPAGEPPGLAGAVRRFRGGAGAGTAHPGPSEKFFQIFPLTNRPGLCKLYIKYGKCDDRENVAASISESRRLLRGGMRTDDLLALEQSAESPSRGRRCDRVPHRYQRGGIHPLWADVREWISSDINKSGTAEAKLWSLTEETKAFLFAKVLAQGKYPNIRRT